MAELPSRILVGVWKDKLTPSTAVALARSLRAKYAGERLPGLIGVAPPPVATMAVQEALRGGPVEVVYQDVHWLDPKSSFIGSTSVGMLRELGIRFSIVGHSERRRFFGDTDQAVCRKLAACLEAGITPILCLGDEDTDLDARRRTLTAQARASLGAGTGAAIDCARIAIAYEPVWAISTWRTDQPLPTGAEVEGMLAMVRDIVAAVTGQSVDRTPFLFGGSVGPKNVDDYFACRGVQGALVGGASLTLDSYDALVRAAKTAWADA